MVRISRDEVGAGTFPDTYATKGYPKAVPFYPLLTSWFYLSRGSSIYYWALFFSRLQHPGFPSLTLDAKLLPIHLAPSVAMLLWGRTPIPKAWSVTSVVHHQLLQ